MTAAAIILSVLLVIFESFILKIVLVLLLLIMGIYLVFMKNRINAINEKTESGLSDFENLHNENIRLSHRLKEVEDLYRDLQNDFTLRENRENAFIEDASLLCTALPLMKELTSLVIVKTEESALNLTENIFQISNKSSQVGNQISNFLNDMFYGDKSLKSNIDILKSEMKRIDSLITDFTSIKERYTLDMRQIENNVKVINGFLSGIRDVSDRTGLLAINSSIEAARVGTAGKGFSVLAGEIHGLAKSSKDISLQIDDIVKIISETVGESFRFLESEISNSLEELSQTQADLNSISTNLTDKVSDVEDHVKDSDNLSKTVTAQLNNVSVNMQYQDITRQILEHIMGTLYFYRTKLEENDSRMIAQNDKKEKKETIIKQASAFFTIEDEWKLFGLETVPAVPTDRKDHEYKGNVELF
jgi:methyl-accepting chemotaxis protein